MNVPRETSNEPDLVRRDFIEAYDHRWACGQKYAEGLMEHVETGAQEDALADFYQQLCHMHTAVLLQHGGQVAQGLAVAVREIQKLIPDDKKQAAVVRFAENADATARSTTADVPRETSGGPS